MYVASQLSGHRCVDRSGIYVKGSPPEAGLFHDVVTVEVVEAGPTGNVRGVDRHGDIVNEELHRGPSPVDHDLQFIPCGHCYRHSRVGAGLTYPVSRDGLPAPAVLIVLVLERDALGDSVGNSGFSKPGTDSVSVRRCGQEWA